MSTALWVVLPYLCLTLFVAGHLWRYRYDQFGWTTRSSQIFESRQLAWAGPLFHFGILGVLGGHVVGLLIPASVTGAIGISEGLYHSIAAVAGSIAGLMTITGLILLVRRRALTLSVFRVTTRMDMTMYLVLGAVIAVGTFNTIGINLLGPGHDYRADVAVWLRSVLLLQPDPGLMASAPLTFQLHALLSLALLALWPFTRLVHVFSVPLAYVARPYIVYRTRDAKAGSRRPPPGWEQPGS